MAKRDTGVGSKAKRQIGPHKTKKRLAIKLARLTELMNKNRRHNRRVRSIVHK
jgi:hypothetical protein